MKYLPLILIWAGVLISITGIILMGIQSTRIKKMKQKRASEEYHKQSIVIDLTEPFTVEDVVIEGSMKEFNAIHFDSTEFVNGKWSDTP